MDQVMKHIVIYSIAVRIFPEPILITQSSLFHLFISLKGLSLHFEHFLNHMQLFYFIHFRRIAIFVNGRCIRFAFTLLIWWLLHFMAFWTTNSQTLILFNQILLRWCFFFSLLLSVLVSAFFVASKRTYVGSNWCKLISILAKRYEIVIFYYISMLLLLFLCVNFFVSMWYSKSTMHNSWHSYTHTKYTFKHLFLSNQWQLNTRYITWKRKCITFAT